MAYAVVLLIPSLIPLQESIDDKAPYLLLIERLGADNIQEREESMAELLRMALEKKMAVPMTGILEGLVKNKNNLEVAHRAKRILDAIPSEYKYLFQRSKIDERVVEHRLWLAHYALSLGLPKEAIKELKQAVKLDQTSLAPSTERKKAVSQKLAWATGELVRMREASMANETLELLKRDYGKFVDQGELEKLKKDLAELNEALNVGFPGILKMTGVLRSASVKDLYMATIESKNTGKSYTAFEGGTFKDENGEPAEELKHWKVIGIRKNAIRLSYRGIPYQPELRQDWWTQDQDRKPEK